CVGLSVQGETRQSASSNTGSTSQKRRGEQAMSRTLRSTFGVTLCLLALASPRLGAAEPPAPPLPTAQLMAVEGASHTYPLMDYDQRVITATVPPQALAHHPTPAPRRPLPGP